VRHLARARSDDPQKQEVPKLSAKARNLSKSQGVSLMEIIAMLTILGIAIVAMFSTVTGGIFFAKDSENRIKAINLARE
jgi:Tfp pilus assembly protein PilV